MRDAHRLKTKNPREAIEYYNIQQSNRSISNSWLKLGLFAFQTFTHHSPNTQRLLVKHHPNCQTFFWKPNQTKGPAFFRSGSACDAVGPKVLQCPRLLQIIHRSFLQNGIVILTFPYPIVISPFVGNHKL